MAPTPPAPARPRRNLRLTLLAVVLLLAGVGAITYAATHQRHAPQPSPSAAGVIRTSPKRATSTAPGRVPGPAPSTSSAGPTTTTRPASPPVSIRIPDIGVASDLIRVGLNPDRTLETPQPGPDYDKAAWYRYSPAPGQLGPSIIEGHVDSARSGPSVFFKLGALRPGAHVEVTLADRSVVVFKVIGVREYPKDAFPTQEVYGNTTEPDLRLITCGGSFDRASGHYRSNIVAFATLVGRRSA